MVTMNVFPTEQDAIDAQEEDFILYKGSQPKTLPTSYWRTTTEWAEVMKRIDAEEWFYLVCPQGVQTHNQKEFNESWVLPITGDV